MSSETTEVSGGSGRIPATMRWGGVSVIWVIGCPKIEEFYFLIPIILFLLPYDNYFVSLLLV